MRSGFYQNTLGEVLAFKKRRRLGLIFLLCGILLFGGLDVQGQVPNRFNFQGVARDAVGKVLVNQLIVLDIYIAPDDPLDTYLYNEVHTITTNPSGTFNITIGSLGNTGNQGDLLAAQWGTKTYSLQIFLYTNPQANPVDLGKTQLVSVPFSIYSDKANLAKSADLAKESEKWVAEFPVIQTGTANSPSLPNVGFGNKLIWYPRKAAFRSGSVTGNQWEDGQIGINSFAAGLDVIALGAQSVTLGNGLISKANGGVVLGSFNNNSDNPDGSSNDRIFQIGNGLNDANRTNALTILKSGNVGIGSNTTVPEYRLDVGGRMRVKHTAGQTSGIYFSSTVGDEAAFVGMKTNSEIGFFTGGDWRFWVNEQGNGFLNGNIIQTSDRRLKRDFSPVSNSLSKLTNLTGQHYFWKDTAKSQELQTGLIAQEVEQYFPELVTTDDKGFKAVNYIGLIPHLIESVKTLKAQTETINALEKQMQDLRAEVYNMKATTSNHIKLEAK
jgi:hypothetical protein